MRYPTECDGSLSDALKMTFKKYSHVTNAIVLFRNKSPLAARASRQILISVGRRWSLSHFCARDVIYLKNLDLIFTLIGFFSRILNELRAREQHSSIHIILHFYEILNLTLKYDRF